MNTKWFHSPSWSGHIKVNNLDDVIDMKRFRNRSFKTLKEVTRESQERQAELKAKEIISDFFKIVANEMIDDRAVFIFPAQRFGFMRIADVGVDPGGSRYMKHIKDDFIVPGGKLFLDPLVEKINGGRKYRFKLIRRLHDRLRENRFKGLRYVE